MNSRGEIAVNAKELNCRAKTAYLQKVMFEKSLLTI